MTTSKMQSLSPIWSRRKGLNCSNKQKYIKIFFKKDKASLVAILETKIRKRNKDVPTEKRCYINFVYGEPKRAFMRRFIQYCTKHLGDFNSIICPCDRLRGTKLSVAKIEAFHKCIKECGLLELRRLGAKFTSTNKHVWSNMDRFFTNMSGTVCLIMSNLSVYLLDYQITHPFVYHFPDALS
ncbi:hypothetical protein Cgig2_021441 [Carnegiea gigantea]|uniref:Uncharacterized protein n=1 Tax=Carnegiea gigantea TaxID=171969 RepID=A0A9Q1K4M3_9CARY|nr:hypothetical protein Cgig2_021441 [Carnegiea gigantea]